MDPVLPEFLIFRREAKTPIFLMEILQIFKCRPPSKKKLVIFYSSSQPLLGWVQSTACQFSTVDVCISVFVFVLMDFPSLFMWPSSLALGEWPRHGHSCMPGGRSSTLHIEAAS